MQDFGKAFHLAVGLVYTANANLIEIIGLILRVSLTAVAISCTYQDINNQVSRRSKRKK